MVGIARRLAGHLTRGLAMIWVVMTFTFFLVHALPGDPVQAQYEKLVSQGMDPQQAERQTAVTYGFLPKGSLWHQYLDYLWRMVHLDLGVSVNAQGVSVADMVASAVPWTVFLVLTGVLLSFVIGVLFGVLAAVRRDGRLGSALSVSGSLLHGIPQFVIAVLLVTVFATLWPVLPYGKPYDVEVDPGFNAGFIASVAQYAILPVATYALSAYGGWLLTMRSSVVTVLGDDFILAAELRGMTRPVVLRYLGRNAILPLFTVFALSLGFMFGGAIYIENIFNQPGLGQLLLKSIGTRDYPLMSGAFLLITVAVIAANIVADLLYTVIDPRVRRGEGT